MRVGRVDICFRSSRGPPSEIEMGLPWLPAKTEATLLIFERPNQNPTTLFTSVRF